MGTNPRTTQEILVLIAGSKLSSQIANFVSVLPKPRNATSIPFDVFNLTECVPAYELITSRLPAYSCSLSYTTLSYAI